MVRALRARSKVYDEARVWQDPDYVDSSRILKGCLILNLESDKSCFKQVRTGWKSCSSCNVEMSLESSWNANWTFEIFQMRDNGDFD